MRWCRCSQGRINRGDPLNAGDKPPVVYPEQAKPSTPLQVKKRSTRTSAGRTHGGGSYDVDTFVFKIDTATRIYEFSSGHRRKLDAVDKIEFRIDKKSAYVPVSQRPSGPDEGAGVVVATGGQVGAAARYLCRLARVAAGLRPVEAAA